MIEPVKNLSSCNCMNCYNNIYIMNSQVPKNCNFSPYFECNEKYKFNLAVARLQLGTSQISSRCVDHQTMVTPNVYVSKKLRLKQGAVV